MAFTSVGKGRGYSARLSKQRKKKSRKKMLCYERRNKNLSELGYTSYKAYLESKDWEIIRNEKLRRYPECVLCESPATQVHHLSYDPGTLLGLNWFFLVQLCRTCHRKIEFDGKKKRSIKFVNDTLFELAEKSGKGHRWVIWHNAHVKEWREKRRQAGEEVKIERIRSQPLLASSSSNETITCRICRVLMLSSPNQNKTVQGHILRCHGLESTNYEDANRQNFWYLKC